MRPRFSKIVQLLYYTLLGVCLFSVCLFSTFSHAQDSGSQVVAEVNGTTILKSELMAELRSNLREEVEEFKGEELHVLQKTMLSKMVQRLLLLQAAEKSGLIPGDKKVEQFITSLNRQLPSENKFEAQLQQFGVDKASYRKRLQEELGIKEYLDRKVFRGLEVSKEEVKKSFDKDPSAFAEPKQVCARHIFLRVAEDASGADRNAVRAKLESIRSEIVNDKADFVSMARKYSDANNRGKGGDLGCFTKNQLPKDFSEAAFSTAPKDVSPIVEAKQGYHIIRVSRIKGGEIPAFQKVYEDLEARLLREKRSKRLTDHLEQLESSGKVIVYYD